MLNNQDFTLDRHLYIGGSDIGAILGLSPYRTPLEVWMNKTGRSTDEANNLAIRFGNFAEDFVANEYALQTQSSLVHYPKPIPHPKHPHLVGHVDRFVMPSTPPDQSNQKELFDGKGTCCAAHLLECKTANPFNQSQWGESGTNQVPLPYLVQCLWYLAITNLERTDLAVLFSNQDFRIYTITRDLELEQMMIDKALFFWNNYVLSDIAPPAKCETDYQHLYPIEVKGKSIQADNDLFEMILRLNEVQEEMKTKELEVGHIKEVVMAKCKNAKP
jgi:putative phage-type endonuclease